MDIKGVSFGRYMLQRLLARGGMGEVYLASLIGVAGFEKKCVIKKIRADLASDETFIERFLNEGRTLVALTHSNIVQIFDMGEENGEYYLAMEYVQGGDLRHLLKQIPTHRIPLNIAIGVAMETLKGLSYAHRATDGNGHALGIVHRDVSSSNILISSQGEVKLIDFGIAKAKTIESVSGVVQGKFAYMSPEQARGESLDKRTDLFSLGIVLYEMICGVRPFDGDSDLQALERIKSGDYRPVSQFNDDADKAFEAILAKALNRDREKRYATADAFYDALVEYGRSHHLSSGQREIMAFFKPFMRDDLPVNGSPEMLMDAALDRMLNAQAMVDAGAQTCTLMPTTTDGNSQNSSHISAITGQTGNSHISATTGKRKMISSGDELAEDDAQHLKSILSVEMPEDTEMLPETPAVRRSIQMRRFRLRLRYALIGAFVAILLVVLYSVYFWHIDSIESAKNLRSSLRAMNESKNSINTEAPVQTIAADAPENSVEMSTQRLIFEMYHFFQQGFPLYMRTDPENATMYIVEGSYRALEEKSVILLPGSNAEIAIQAPGYETCLLHMYFDKDSQSAMQNTEWQNCRAVSTRFLAKEQRVEISVSLQAMRPNWGDTPAKSPEADPASEPTEAPDIQVVEPPSDDAPDSEPAPKKNAADTAQKLANTVHPVRTPKKTAKSTETTQSPNTKRQQISHTFKASIPAEVVVDGKHHALPYTLEADVNTAVQIMPAVSGRKIAIPWQSKISGELPSNIDFCEATIRIREYYIDGDPAPYQIADIAVDGTTRARQTDMAIFVLPCGKHTFSASNKEHSVPVSSSIQATLAPGKPFSTFISLSQ